MLATSQDGEIDNVELIFNDLSIHGQFYDPACFREAIDRVMSIRQLARRYGRELYCHRNVQHSKVKENQMLVQHINNSRDFDRDSRSALMQWLGRQGGPFWEDIQHHTADDRLEYNGSKVTNSAVGEAAYCIAHDVERALVSINPSCWLTSPLPVDWHYNSSVKRINVPNYWSVDELKEILEGDPNLESWEDLDKTARIRYPDLTFAPDCFEPLKGHPFNKGSAEGILSRLRVLNTIKNCFDQHGKRTSEGQALYQNRFTGAKAWFSDSSYTEKNQFRTSLTFPHPDDSDKMIFAPWHGKVKDFRIHFKWPISATEPLYVLYAGLKITKR